MLDPRLISTLPQHPFRVEYRVNRRNSRLTLIVDTPDGIAARIVPVIESVLGLGHQLRRAEEAAARNLRTEATIRAWEKQKDAIRRAYRKLRGLGVRHRAAVLAVSEQEAFSDLRTAYGWCRAEFSHCIGPASLYQPSIDPGAVSGRIRGVSSLVLKRAKQPNRGGLVKTGRAAS